MNHTSFKDFMLRSGLIKAIKEAGIEAPYRVQETALRHGLVGTDLIVQAKSGGGKTLIPILIALNAVEYSTASQIDTLFITHTREMSLQIYHEITRFSSWMEGLEVGVVYGGVPIQESKRIIEQNPHILVGTPGRLNHLIETKSINLQTLRRFVIDEADRLIDIETRREIQRIYTKTSKLKQTILMSATMDRALSVCKRFTKRTVQQINEMIPGARRVDIQMHVRWCLSEKSKIRSLVETLDALNFKQTVVFTRTQERAAALNGELSKVCFPSLCIHGGMEQSERFAKYREFKDINHHRLKILVTTDLFGRGVDLENVNLVINFDMAQNSEEYLHRVGRASRAMTKGIAISFLDGAQEEELMKEIETKFEIIVYSIKHRDEIKELNSNFGY